MMKRRVRGAAVGLLASMAGWSSAWSEEFDAVQSRLSPTNTMTCHVRWSDMAVDPLESGEDLFAFTLTYIDDVLWFGGKKVQGVVKPDPANRWIGVSVDHLLEMHGGSELVEKVKSHGGNPYGQRIGLAFKDAQLYLMPVRKTVLNGQPKVVDCERHAAPAPTSDQFSQALDAMGQSGPPLMTYTCRLSGNQVLGVPVIIGQEQFRTVSISIAEDAAGSVNGTVLEPVHIQHAANGDVASVVYDARQFQQAMAGSATAQSMGMDQQSFDRIKELMGGAVDQSMGDRRRFVSIPLDQDTITFFDLDASDQPTSQTVGNCARGM
ncbi:hypothetical protein [Aminobacter ciceronei]|uniref:Uncharacterized protein n=1 Tax=Aminobacter ciceronei TaxID=150723 RepID=A0ABR6CHE8_9HYPH|nr:hypothetical protein [Aminobacter ciceronei]MBA8910696.1 hypothetical protein [Aminobacter ciceronei]MBA9024466.1 hypothetical protein [Aminobacter ciceronei]